MRSLVELDQGPTQNAAAVEADITLSIQLQPKQRPKQGCHLDSCDLLAHYRYT